MNLSEYRIFYSSGIGNRFVVMTAVKAGGFDEAISTWAERDARNTRGLNGRYLVQDKATLDTRLYKVASRFVEV